MTVVTPPPLYKLRKSHKLIRPYTHCSLDKAVDTQVQKEKIVWGTGARKGYIMHKHPQNQSYVGSSGQTLTTNVPMTQCSWRICDQKPCLMWLHYIWYRIKLGPKLMWSLRPLYLGQGRSLYKGRGGGVTTIIRGGVDRSHCPGMAMAQSLGRVHMWEGMPAGRH